MVATEQDQDTDEQEQAPGPRPEMKAWGQENVVITWTRQNEQEEAATNNSNNYQAMTAQGGKKKRKKPYSMLVPGRSVQTYLGACALCLLLMNLGLTHRSHITYLYTCTYTPTHHAPQAPFHFL